MAKFLVDRFGSTPVEVGQIKPSDILNFMVRPTNRYKPGTAGVLGCALRSLFGENTRRVVARKDGTTRFYHGFLRAIIRAGRLTCRASAISATARR